MASKMMWNPHLTAAELETIRLSWLQKAFGSGASKMKEYYDALAPENFVPSPGCTHVVPLNNGEDGSIAMMTWPNGLSFPLVYSLPSPNLWARSPNALVVPRAIAVSDGLTIE